jgi:L-lactate dehydrogenase complex protein LldE
VTKSRKKSEADALVLGDLGCMLNIEGRLRRRGDNRTKVLHVAEVLAGMTGEEVE